MTTQNPHGSQSDNETADLVRSVALSSARLWEEVLERLVRVERSQVELTQTLSRLQAALPSASGAPALSGPSAPTLGLPAASPLLPPPPPPPPPARTAGRPIDVDGVEVANPQGNGGHRAPSALAAPAPQAEPPSMAEPASDAEPAATSPAGPPTASAAPVTSAEGQHQAGDLLPPPPPPPGFANMGEALPPPPPGFITPTEPDTSGAEFLNEGPSELPEPVRGRRFGLRRKPRKGSAPAEATIQVPVDSILAAAAEAPQPEAASPLVSPGGTAGTVGSGAEEAFSAPPSPPTDLPSPAPAEATASVETGIAGLHTPQAPPAPGAPWDVRPEPVNEAGQPSQATTQPEPAWSAAPPPPPEPAWSPTAAPVAQPEPSQPEPSQPEPAWSSAPPPPPDPAWSPTAAPVAQPAPSQPEPAWSSAPPPPDPAWSPTAAPVAQPAPSQPEPAWSSAPPPPDPAWPAAPRPASPPPPPPMVPVVPSAPAAPAFPSAPAGFSLEDLQGEGAIGAPPASPTAAPRPVESLGAPAPSVPSAPAGFSLEDLQGEGAIGAPPAPSPAPPAAPPAAPPPPPPGFSAPSAGIESLGLDPEPGRDQPQVPPTGWESIAPSPSPSMPEGATPPPPSGFERTEMTGRTTAPPPPAGFSTADFSGSDAIGGSSEPAAAPSAAALMGGEVPEPPITPDFFARAGRKRH